MILQLKQGKLVCPHKRKYKGKVKQFDIRRGGGSCRRHCPFFGGVVHLPKKKKGINCSGSPHVDERFVKSKPMPKPTFPPTHYDMEVDKLKVRIHKAGRDLEIGILTERIKISDNFRYLLTNRINGGLSAIREKSSINEPLEELIFWTEYWERSIAELYDHRLQP